MKDLELNSSKLLPHVISTDFAFLLQFPSVWNLPHFERFCSCLHVIILSCINDMCMCVYACIYFKSCIYFCLVMRCNFKWETDLLFWQSHYYYGSVKGINGCIVFKVTIEVQSLLLRWVYIANILYRTCVLYTLWNGWNAVWWHKVMFHKNWLFYTCAGLLILLNEWPYFVFGFCICVWSFFSTLIFYHGCLANYLW